MATQERRAAAPTPLRQVRHLRNDLQMTETDLAEATGASTRTVRRWSGAQAALRAPRYADRIDDLHAVVAELEDSLTAKGIRQWLRARNRSLSGARRPIELLKKGEFKPVYEAACAFRDGEYL